MKEETPEKNLATEEKIEPIKVPWYEKIPFVLKALFIKYWFMGLDYFLFAMGLTYWMDKDFAAQPGYAYLQMAILGLAMGFFNDFMLYNIYGALETNRREAVWYEIYKSKKFYSLLINLAYGLAWGFATSFVGGYLASLCANGLFQEAFSWAFLGLVVDAFLLFLKDIPLYLVKKKRGEAINL